MSIEQRIAKKLLELFPDDCHSDYKEGFTNIIRTELQELRGSLKELLDSTSMLTTRAPYRLELKEVDRILTAATRLRAILGE